MELREIVHNLIKKLQNELKQLKAKPEPSKFVCNPSDKFIDAIETITQSRQTHIEWRDYFMINPDESCKKEFEHLGNADFHALCISKYTRVITLINDCKQQAAELEKLKQKQWADLNTARCVLLNRIEDLNALAEDIRLKELELKKVLGEPGSESHPRRRDDDSAKMSDG